MSPPGRPAPPSYLRIWMTAPPPQLLYEGLDPPLLLSPRGWLWRGSTVKLNGSIKSKNTQNIYCSMDAIYFYRSICKKTNLCLYPETVTKNRPKFRRKSTGSQGSKLNNKTKLLNSAVVYCEKLCRFPKILSTSAFSQSPWICIILHILLSLIQ